MNILKKITALTASALVVVAALLAAAFVRPSAAPVRNDSRLFSESVNLALRRTGHALLISVGDSTSRIAPVQQDDDRTFRLRMDRAFDYSRLPALLDASFRRYGVKVAYDVAVFDCAKGELLLGYSARDLADPAGIPCRDRSRTPGCYTFQVRFSPGETASASVNGWMIVALGGLLAGLVFTVWPRADRPTAEANTDVPGTSVPGVDTSGVDTSGVDTPDLLRLGNSRFDPVNQILFSGTTRQALTYREAKLLRLFAEHTNQLLERDFILQSVWEDEGIVVGRSLDVFVSRLRKLLRHDPTLRLAAVHGVGYRLEVELPG
ncbi:winged helix-turn-helix domain-containing protein [Larkinella soli]|uniref:winged helix-turn-helix domain-containing protein n=1 Tax=Larkinella soli TaxID=1770527 RepID=UPI000FFB7805|nr:winged helix-turn-helix domain-containing protein [Larkinella soli]